MATDRQIAANRANARKSTGPRTAAGKAASSRNSTSHGLCSSQFVLQPGEEDEFDDFMSALHDDLQPRGPLEHDLFTQIAHASWTLRRCRRAEVLLQSNYGCNHAEPRVSNLLADKCRNLDLYIRRAERSYQMALAQLRLLQTNRLLAAETSLAYGPTLSPDPAPLADAQKLHRPLISLATHRQNRQRTDDLLRRAPFPLKFPDLLREQTNPISPTQPHSPDPLQPCQ